MTVLPIEEVNEIISDLKQMIEEIKAASSEFDIANKINDLSCDEDWKLILEQNLEIEELKARLKRAEAYKAEHYK